MNESVPSDDTDRINTTIRLHAAMERYAQLYQDFVNALDRHNAGDLPPEQKCSMFATFLIQLSRENFSLSVPLPLVVEDMVRDGAKKFLKVETARLLSLFAEPEEPEPPSPPSATPTGVPPRTFSLIEDPDTARLIDLLTSSIRRLIVYAKGTPAEREAIDVLKFAGDPDGPKEDSDG